MKNFIAVVVGIFAFAGSSAQAASKADVWNLMERISGELRYYNQSPGDIDQVHARLEEALRILRGNSEADPQACNNFAYSELKNDGYSNSTSLEKAKAFCTKAANAGITLNVVEFFYENLRKDGYSVSTSLDHTLELASKITEQKLPCVKSAFERYSQDGYSRHTSLERAVKYCAE